MAYNLTSSGNNGSFVATYITGKFGQGTQGPGGGTAPGVAAAMGTTFTIGGWINTSSASGVILGQAGFAVIEASSASNLRATYGNSGAVIITTTVNIADSAWHHFALVVGPNVGGTGVGGLFFIDGVLAGSGGSPTNFDAALNTMGFGEHHYSGTSVGYPWTGGMDEIAFWNYARYTANFTPPTAPYSGSEANLVALYHLDGNGTDSSVAPVAATAITLTGPASGNVGAASSNFTVALSPNGSTVTGTVTVTPSDGGAGGTFTPTSRGLTTAAPSATFTYTPSSAGSKTISVTNSGSLTNPSSITYTANAVPATAILVSGPTSGAPGVASSNFTVSANGAITGTVVVTPSASGCTFTPTTVSISAGTPTATFTVTPAAAGTSTISFANNGSLTNPGNMTYTASTTTATFAASGTMKNLNGSVVADGSYTVLVRTKAPASGSTVAVKTGLAVVNGICPGFSIAGPVAGTEYKMELINEADNNIVGLSRATPT